MNKYNVTIRDLILFKTETVSVVADSIPQAVVRVMDSKTNPKNWVLVEATQAASSDTLSSPCDTQDNKCCGKCRGCK